MVQMKLLKSFTEKPSLKTFLIFFLIILIPNILRQIYYFVAVNKFNSIDYIASFETQQIFSSSFPFLGICEEIIIGLIYAFLWFKFRPARFLSYGWISDAMIFFIYLIFGILFAKLKLSIKKLSFIFSGAGVVMLLIIIILK